MQCIRIAVLSLSLFALAVSGNMTVAQELSGGFKKSSGADATVAELIANPDLFVMDVQFKPIRLIRMDVTDPKSGRTSRELVWYMVYRVINRDLNREQDQTDSVPINSEDKKPKTIFSPRFTIVTADAGEPKIYKDVVHPQIQKQIERREGIQLKNSIQLNGPPPPITAVGSPDEVRNARYGVAVWRNVDPTTDRVVVYITGMSNAYRLVKGPANELMVERKTVVQEFWRPGDEFEQDEEEFRIQGDPKWIYRLQSQPLGLKPKVPVGTPPAIDPAKDDA